MLLLGLALLCVATALDAPDLTYDESYAYDKILFAVAAASPAPVPSDRINAIVLRDTTWSESSVAGCMQWLTASLAELVAQNEAMQETMASMVQEMRMMRAMAYGSSWSSWTTQDDAPPFPDLLDLFTFALLVAFLACACCGSHRAERVVRVVAPPRSPDPKVIEV